LGEEGIIGFQNRVEQETRQHEWFHDHIEGEKVMQTPESWLDKNVGKALKCYDCSKSIFPTEYAVHGGLCENCYVKKWGKQKLFSELEKTESAWLAGIIDGEGSINSYFRDKERRNGKGSNYGIFLQIVNSDKDIIDKVVDLCGVKIAYESQRPNRRKMYHVTINKTSEIIRILKSIHPYLTGYKQRRAELALEYCISRGRWGKGNGHQLTDEEINLLKTIQETKRG